MRQYTPAQYVHLRLALIYKNTEIEISSPNCVLRVVQGQLSRSQARPAIVGLPEEEIAAPSKHVMDGGR